MMMVVAMMIAMTITMRMVARMLVMYDDYISCADNYDVGSDSDDDGDDSCCDYNLERKRFTSSYNPMY